MRHTVASCSFKYMKKVLVLDIDGTLVTTEKEITPATKQAIWDILERGHQVMLASGRPLPGMRRYERELELPQRGGYIMASNGAKIVDCRTGEIVYQKVLPLSMVPTIYEYAQEHGCGLITFLGDNSISAFEPDEYVEYEARINGITIRVVENWPEFVNFDINKCIVTAEPAKAAVCEKELQKLLAGVANVFRSDPFFIEVVPIGVDKALSLEKMLPILGVEQEGTVCCGDGFNDISMLKYAAVGVAMGNAQAEVKAVADYVTATNDEDGIVEVIKEFFYEDSVT